MGKTTDAWERWGKRLSVILAIITILTAIGGGGEWLYDKLTGRPRLLVRRRVFTELQGKPEFDLTFTIANNASSPIYINELYFLEGPFTVGTGFGASMAVPRYYDRIHLSSITVTETKPPRVSKPVLANRRGVNFESSAHRIFMGPRLRLEPTEQLDYYLTIDATWPKDIDRTSLKEPQMQAWMILYWEDARGQPSVARTNCNLLFW